MGPPRRSAHSPPPPPVPTFQPTIPSDPHYWNPRSIFIKDLQIKPNTDDIMETWSRNSHQDEEYDFVKLYQQLKEAVPLESSTSAQAAREVTDEININSEQDRRSQHARFPNVNIKVFDWTGIIVYNRILGSGGFGDVYYGEWKDLPPLTGLAIPPLIVVKKSKLAPSAEDSKNKGVKEILREIVVWQRLKHENVVPFVGIIDIPGFFPGLVSVWMSNGTIHSLMPFTHPQCAMYHFQGPIKVYIDKNSSKVCLRSMIWGVIRGLHFLHEQEKPIVHGDLKADNVLINGQGLPCLCDFGLSRVLEENSLWNTSASQAKGTMRWMAPELLDDERPQITVSTECDIYAFAMTCYEILTGRIPFHDRRDGTALNLVMKGKRPMRDASCITEDIWMLMQHCWAHNQEDRPSSSEIFKKMFKACRCQQTGNQLDCIFRDRQFEIAQ